jgi:hypothetical protein
VVPSPLFFLGGGGGGGGAAFAYRTTCSPEHFLLHPHTHTHTHSTHQWLYTRSDKRAMKEEARGAALLEMLPLRDYVAATLEDPTRAATFRRHVALVRKSWWVF